MTWLHKCLASILILRHCQRCSAQLTQGIAFRMSTMLAVSHLLAVLTAAAACCLDQSLSREVKAHKLLLTWLAGSS